MLQQTNSNFLFLKKKQLIELLLWLFLLLKLKQVCLSGNVLESSKHTQHCFYQEPGTEKECNTFFVLLWNPSKLGEPDFIHILNVWRKKFTFCLFTQGFVQKKYALEVVTIIWEYNRLRMWVLTLILWTFCSGPSGI